MKHKTLYCILCAALVTLAPPCSVDSNADYFPEVKPVIIIDSGHTINSPGVMSATGKYEVAYNDRLTSIITDVLTEAGFEVIPTRKLDQEISLKDRLTVANSKNALAMLSIHHDSAQPIYLTLSENGVGTAYKTRKRISGYSIFVSKTSKAFDRSFAFAKRLALELKKLGRKPTLHHAEPIQGEGKALLDANLGIYNYDDLVVLKYSAIPAVLLEVGVIVDPIDEACVSNPAHQKAIARAILKALLSFKQTQI